MIAAIRLHEFANAFERRKPHGRADFGHFAVRADVNHVVVSGEPEVAHQAHFRRQCVIVGHDGAALEAVDKFRGVKAEHFAATEAADHLPL